LLEAIDLKVLFLEIDGDTKTKYVTGSQRVVSKELLVNEDWRTTKMHPNEYYFNQRISNFEEVPSYVLVESYMGCNLHCPMCPVPNSKQLMNGRAPFSMEKEIFALIISQISDKPRTIHLTQLGEPLLNPNIVDFVSLAKSRRHKVGLTTNGTRMSPEMTHALLKAGLDLVIFSFDGSEKDTYESIRQGAQYEDVLNKIRYFSHYARINNCECKIQVDCIISDLTINEVDRMKNLWAGVAILNFIPLDDWGGKIELPEKFGKKRTIIKEKLSPKDRYPCDLLWTTLTISAEGKVMFCCHDYNLFSDLPKVTAKPIHLIWKEDVGLERKKQISADYSSPSCKNCEAWMTRPIFYR
jgi:MoaA/NifB/PqqE/SkfB family radical SAM enzyme